MLRLGERGGTPELGKCWSFSNGLLWQVTSCANACQAMCKPSPAFCRANRVEGEMDMGAPEKISRLGMLLDVVAVKD